MCGKRTEVVKGISSGAPRIISWNITQRCPLKCPHCYVDTSEREAEGVLSTEEAFGVIDQICKTGKPVAVLSGSRTHNSRSFFIKNKNFFDIYPEIT